MRQVLAAVLATMLLAGCTEAPEAPDDHDDHEDGDGNGTLETVLAAALTTDVLNGTAPLLVQFNITAQNATANATWSLDFGDGNATNGTGLPATANHTFGAGSFTASLVVTDGNMTSSASIDIVAAAAVPTSGRPLGSVPFTADGMFPTGTQGAEGCGVQSGVDIHEHDWVIPEDIEGVAARVATFTVHMDIGATNIDSDVYLLDPAGNTVGSSADFNAPGLGSGSPTEDFTVNGDWAPGTYQIVVRACTGAAMDYEVTGQADMVSA